MKVCRLQDCQRKHYGNGLCHLHYQRLKRTGSFASSDNRMVKNRIDRFWTYVIKPEPESCWLWNGGWSKGYGSYSNHGLKSETKLAHRISYEVTYGKVPAGKQLDHLCHNRSCVNPEHLEIVSNRENTIRGDRVGTKKSGLPVGVCRTKYDRYQAIRMLSPGNRLYIGTFSTPEDASIAYQTAILI